MGDFLLSTSASIRNYSEAVPRGPPIWIWIFDSSPRFGVIFDFFDFIPWKPTDTWPRDRCGRAQLVLLPSLVDFLHLGADL